MGDKDSILVIEDNDLDRELVCEILGKDYKMTCVSMGNPHAVVFMDGVKELDIEAIGPHFENHERFPKRTNTEFVEIISRTEASMRVCRN